MIIITESFSGIVDDWLANQSLALAEEDQLKPGEPLTKERWAEKIRAAVELSAGPARGLEIGELVQLRHVGALGYLAVNGRSLGQFLDTYVAFEKWLFGNTVVKSSIEDEQISLRWDAADVGQLDRLLEQVHISALLTVIRKACPSAPPPNEVGVMNPELDEGHLYQAHLGCPVKFDQPALRLTYPLAALKKTIDTADSSLSAAWATRQRTLRDSFPGAVHFVQAVQEAIMQHLPRGAPADLVAESLNLSRRTLQRRLGDAGVSYRELLDGIRESHARNLLEDPQLSLKEIAFLLGYSEQSAFNHAYRRWNRESPMKARS